MQVPLSLSLSAGSTRTLSRRTARSSTRGEPASPHTRRPAAEALCACACNMRSELRRILDAHAQVQRAADGRAEGRLAHRGRPPPYRRDERRGSALALSMCRVNIHYSISKFTLSISNLTPIFDICSTLGSPTQCGGSGGTSPGRPTPRWRPSTLAAASRRGHASTASRSRACG